MTVKTAIRRTRVKKRKKAASNDRMKLALDADCRLNVFDRDEWKCQRCGAGADTVLQWSHVHSRRHHCLRWDVDNSKVLCRACHCWWGNNPGLAFDWFSKKWPERWERITRVLQLNPKVRVKELYAEMKRGGCRCQVPNSGIPLTGDQKCSVCEKEV